jgi:enoyl-CoA hydratase
LITINRPEAMNALNTAVMKELDAAIIRAEEDDDVYVMIITGAGRAFVAGADISQMKDLTSMEAKVFGEMGNRVFSRIENKIKPVIAAVNGYALGGGCELAMACDICVAAEKARFGQVEVRLGIIPGFGGTQRLPRIVGTSKAKELIFTGATIDAQEAYRITMVSKVVPGEMLMETAFDLAKKIASNAQMAVRQSKSAINKGMQCDIRTATSFETEAFAVCFSTLDQKEAMSAFLDKKDMDGFKNK